jgi:hypothetical protein
MACEPDWNSWEEIQKTRQALEHWGFDNLDELKASFHAQRKEIEEENEENFRRYQHECQLSQFPCRVVCDGVLSELTDGCEQEGRRSSRLSPLKLLARLISLVEYWEYLLTPPWPS